MTTKSMRTEIKETYAGVPSAEVYTGGYLKKVGTKFVTICDTWETTSLKKIPLVAFYNQYILKHSVVEDYNGNYYDGDINQVIA